MNLKEELKKHKLTQYKLAKMMGIREQTVSNWCTGRHKPIGVYQKILDEIFEKLDKL